MPVPKKTIAATEVLTLGAAAVGEFRNGHKLPRPRAVGAILLMYGLLGLAADLGREAGRIAAAIAVVLLVATVFIGAAGKTLVDLLNQATALMTGKPAKTSTVTAPVSDAASGGPLQPVPRTALRPARP